MSDPEALVPGPITFIPGKTDAQKATDYRTEMNVALAPVCDIIERARKDGLAIGWASLGPDEFGKVRVPFISVTKPL